MSDKTVNILLFLAQGFENLEAVAIIDVFGWTRYRENLKAASVTTTGFHPIVKSRFGLKVGILAVEIVISERMSPWRLMTTSKKIRWISNLGITFLNPLVVHSFFSIWYVPIIFSEP
jgi:hypothetical protein